MIKKSGFVLGMAVLLAVLTSTGYWLLFSSFAVFDDEGYILLSVRDYFAHGHLYETVYSQYGPAFYAMWDVFQQVIGQPVDHTWARLVTLAFWIGTATSCAFLVRRQTRSSSLSLFTQAATFLFLYFITDEPFHPGSLICFMLAASLAAAAWLIDRERLSAAAVVVGCAGAILLLTKINVGVFYLLSAGGWALTNASSERVRRIFKSVVPAVFLLMAAVLMHTLIREPWIWVFLILFACGALALGIATKGESLLTGRHAIFGALGAVALGLAILGSIWLRGTSPAGLLEGVILGPLRHPGNYSYPVDWRPGSVVVAVLSLIFAVYHRWLERRFSHQAADRLLLVLRMVTGSALVVGFVLLINFRAVGAIFSYVAPLIWIWSIPLKCIETTAENRAVRSLLACVLLLQFLHAYPVGGSQESWGVFLFFPLVTLGLGDVRLWLLSRSPAQTKPIFRWWTVSTLLLAAVLAKSGWTAVHARRHYAAGVPLALPGAGDLRLPEFQSASYQILSLNAAVHSDLLFSLPGMFSFNVWTGLPTPTDKNTTLWFTLLNDQEQQAIIDVLERTPRAAVIAQESLLEMMQANHLPMRGILWDYVHQHFRPAFRIDGFAFWVRSRRIIASFNVAALKSRHGADDESQPRDTQLDFNLISEGPPIVAIEIKSSAKDQASPLVLDGTNAVAVITPINSAGRAMAESTQATWPLTLKGPVHVRIDFDRGDHALSPSDTLLQLRGTGSENLGEILIGE
ncbi:MAG: hypothetical protein ABI273_18745 [Lacunisphaera sp.]